MTATAPVSAREDYQAMEFSVTKSALLNELNTTQGVVERKTTIPILSNILVEAKGSRLTITATDLELSIRTSCEDTTSFTSFLIKFKTLLLMKASYPAHFHSVY